MKQPMLHPADEIIQTMARIYAGGMTTVSGGNLSIRDADGTVWISPSGNDKAGLARTDVSRIAPDGTVSGKSKVSLETPIHQAVLAGRPDLKAVLHAHPPALVTLSLMREAVNTRLLPQLHEMVDKIGIAPYAKPGSEALRDNVSAVFRQGYDAVILENHGIFIGSKVSLTHAYHLFESLDFAARLQLSAPGLSGTEASSVTDAQMESYRRFAAEQAPEFAQDCHSGEELLVRQSLTRLVRRAYEKQMFAAMHGVASAKYAQGGFVITPAQVDRAFIENEDFVTVEGGQREAGKTPDPLHKLHRLIYEKNEDITSIFCFTAPWAMTFAVTENEYDVSLIPECFLRLRGTRKFSIETLFQRPEEIAAAVDLACPVILIENYCVLIAGVSPFATYDRMEICENSARSVHYAKTARKPIVKLNEEQLDELRAGFRILKPTPIDLDILL